MMNRKGAKFTGSFVNGFGDAPERNTFKNQLVNSVPEPEK